MRFIKLFALALLSTNCGLGAVTIQGKVVGVADGDTITVLDATNTQHKIRLQGIDAPEKAQAFGQKSKQSLYLLVHNKQVTIEFQKADKYGRTLGKVVHNGTVVHENVPVTGPTRAAHWNDEQPTGPLLLQGDHGPVAYRNVRVRPLPQ